MKFILPVQPSMLQQNFIALQIKSINCFHLFFECTESGDIYKTSINFISTGSKEIHGRYFIFEIRQTIGAHLPALHSQTWVKWKQCNLIVVFRVFSFDAPNVRPHADEQHRLCAELKSHSNFNAFTQRALTLLSSFVWRRIGTTIEFHIFTLSKY